MRTSKLLLATLKETPADAEVVSHQLMLRAGMVRKLAAGLYSWLPLGLKVLRKVEAIVREEMDLAGAQELLMPVVQPAELWQESGRWEQYGPELLRLKDRHDRDFCLGPTHEEVITDMLRNELQSYKQLPVNFYQIQTKFRDEIRPRFGLMRGREFTMKDAYSFHIDRNSLAETYQVMYDAYARIFSRLGLDYRAVIADTGSIGGSASHEFHVLAESGEDAIAFSSASDYAANVEMAEAVPPAGNRASAGAGIKEVTTPGIGSIDELCQFLSIAPEQTLKTLIVSGSSKEQPLIALAVRGDHTLNAIKAEKLTGVANPLRLADNAEIQAVVACGPGSLGPVGLRIPLIVDHSASHLANFVAGSNKNGVHLCNINWGRDLPEPQVADIRNVVAGDPSPDGKGTLDIKRGIEVGHIFQLGRKYSAAMNASVVGEDGAQNIMEMGCYGIGVSRVVAAAIEQNHDAKGIIWSDALAPYSVVVIGLNMHKSPAVTAAAEMLYQQLIACDIDVLLDDRDERPGVKFADMELIGIPHRVVIGDRGLERDQLEYKHRRDEHLTEVSRAEIVSFLKTRLQAGGREFDRA